MREALGAKKPITVDLSQTNAIDARFLGLLLMLRKQLKVQGADLKFTGFSRSLEKTFRLNGVDYLLHDGKPV